MEYDEIDPTAPIIVMFDVSSRNWQATQEYNSKFLSITTAIITDKLHAQGHLFVNELLDRLDIPRTPAGALVGWTAEEEIPHVLFSWKYETEPTLVTIYPQGFIWNKIGQE